jgi:hypothetical protein
MAKARTTTRKPKTAARKVPKKAARKAPGKAPSKGPKTAPKTAPKSKRVARSQPHLVHHADGTLWAKGQTRDGVLFGYWEWFRKDGTMLRSGTFGRDGEPTGTWTTYDRRGVAHKVTDLP